jgi:hypothetical protein
MHTARDARGFEFESALSKIARVLTGQYGVTVVFSPDGPRVEPGRIVIPDYEVGDSLSTDVLVGYLDLLVARAKHSALSQLAALPQGVATSLAQVIEDRRRARSKAGIDCAGATASSGAWNARCGTNLWRAAKRASRSLLRWWQRRI